MRAQLTSHSSGLEPFAIEIAGNAVVARCTVDSLTDRQVLEVSLRAIEQSARERSLPVLLNLQNLRYLATEAVGTILSMRNRLDEYDCRVALCSLDPSVQKLLSAIHLDLLFRIWPDENDAIAAFDAE